MKILEGNIFDSKAKTLVNTVNCVGIMGKGIALEYKKRYPEMFKKYKYICNNNLLTTGQLFLWKSNDKFILNFPTKKHWKDKSKLEWIEEGLLKFVKTYKEKGIKSIAFPQLGCANGGLDWDNEVFPLMQKYLNNLEDIEIEIYIYK